MTRLTTPRPMAILVALAMILAAAAGGSVIGQVGLADAVVDSGDKPVTVNIDLVRIRDTRTVFGGPIGGDGTPLGTRATEILKVAGNNGIPADAEAVCINLTVLDATADTFVSVYGAALPSGQIPKTSTVNPGPGSTSVNGVIVPLDASGQMRIYNNSGSVNYFIDLSCYTSDHNHDDRYYTEAETYTQAEVDAAIAAALVDPILPAGATITGTAKFDSHSFQADADYYETIELPAKVPFNLTSDDVNFAPYTPAPTLIADPDPTCTGTAAAPTAPPGKVCIYILSTGEADGITGSASTAFQNRYFNIWWASIGAGDMYLDITWAYTAP